MESCFLCLELNKDILEGIWANTMQWQELNVAKIIKKYFWSVDSIQLGPWICVPCWRDVESFHKFYLRIEEAHMNFGKIKVEGESDKDMKALSFFEREIQIDDEQEWNLTEPEILVEQPIMHELVDKISKISNSNRLDSDDFPLTMSLQSKLESTDPLEKGEKCKKKKNAKKKVSTEKKYTTEKKLKDSGETVNLSDKNLVSLADSCNISDDKYNPHKDLSVSSKGKKRGRHHPNRKENDKFIAEHFKQMFCNLCKLPIQDFPHMQKHFSEAHKQRGYVVCCKRKFSDRTRLVDHLHCHLNPDHFKCSECGKTMSDRIKFENHILRVHKANEIVKQHFCDICGKSFKEAYVLRTHKLTHLPEEEKKFQCEDCGKNYGSPYLLNQHRQVVHLKRFVKVCDICGKEINSSAEFKIHINKHEGIPPPNIHCDICGLRLISERGLKVHKKSQHPVGGKQEHPCPVCDKVSPTARALKKHINTMHEKGFDHKCTICGKAFRRAGTLKEHMASHTGTPLYACPWCPMRFNSNGNMHAHRKNKHPREYLELKQQNYSFPALV